MSFNLFDMTVNTQITPSEPNKWYRDLQQAFICENWDNTTSKMIIGEQKINSNQADYYENFEFDDIEAWVNTVVGQSSTGQKTGRDFIQLIFHDITHPKLEGRYYIVDNEYYISYFDNRVVDVDANLSVRRCNEWMKIIDPLSGAIYQIPCVVDYDMSAPSNRVSNAIITPNNHAVVKVQQNEMTDRLFVTNARFILGNRPFKIAGMQNATNQFINNSISSLMEIDLFLDEIWEQDNIELGLAYNGKFNYTIIVNTNSMEVAENSSGRIYADVVLNGTDVERVLNWKSSNNDIVTVNQEGQYQVVGQIGDTATLTVSLYNNDLVFENIEIVIVENASSEAEVLIDPVIKTIREYEDINLVIYGVLDGNLLIPETINITSTEDLSEYLSWNINSNIISLHCLKRKKDIVNIYITISSTNPVFSATKDVPLKLTSLLG